MMGTTARRAMTFAWPELLKSRWLWCIGVVLFVCLRELSSGFGDLLNSLGDTDDATRLYEVRAFLGGTSWFDMALPRLGGATPLVSHWSRLIDLPLVALLDLFGLFMSQATAELTARIVWPMLVLAAMFRVLVREAESQAGADAAWLMLFLGLTCMTGLSQFRIGRIDHHNVMIFGSIAGLLVLLRGRLEPRQGYFAGSLIGIGLAVGYEPLALLLPALCAAAFIAVIDIRWLTGVRNMAVMLTATLGLVFVTTVAPSLWLVPRCDALSFNMVLLVGVGAFGLEIINRHGRNWTPAHRISALVAAGAVGLLVYGTFDTRCLAGPFGQVDAAVKPVWLDFVIEMWNVFAFFPLSPASIVSFLMLMLAGSTAAMERWHRLRTPESLALLVLMLIVIPPALWMVKLTPYASWVAVFCIALSIADLRAIGSASVLTVQLCGALLLNQSGMTMLATSALTLAHVPNATATNEAIADSAKCMTTPAIRALTPLPKGLFVGSIDLGPYIVGLTQHDMLAAPYHRIDQAIIANEAILAAEPAKAKELLDKVGADYLVLCLSENRSSKEAPQAGASIETRLRAGLSIDYLEPVTLAGAVPEMRVWRVAR
jgi:hypothetical protein